MAYNKVKFLRGTSDEYAVAEKDNDTIYFTTDDGKLYIGNKEVSGDGSLTIDETLSDTSTNPVQNKVVKQAIDNKADKSKYGDTTINVGRKPGTDVGNYSTAEGYNTTASGSYSHAEGSNYNSSDTDAFPDRTVTISNVDYTISGSTAYGVNSHAEGTQSFAYGYSSHAEGCDTIASGAYSHAEGRDTTASGSYSHAEGDFITASGAFSHAEGNNTTASGNCSHAEGCQTTAGGRYSHAGGYYTKALKVAEFAHGQYNQSNNNTLFSVGDGTADNARHNAFEITTDGGKLHDKDIATTDLIPTTLPANGGNADTLNGMSAEAIRSMSKNVDSGTSASSQLADGTYCGVWSDAPSGLADTQGTLIVSNYNTNGAPSPWSHRTFYSPHYNKIWHGFTANYNWYGWAEISTTPIKKISFPSVSTNAGGGGTLFSSDFGTPIVIACTSRADTQCTPFFASNQWLVLAKDAVTLDPIVGSYSFDVWYI